VKRGLAILLGLVLLAPGCITFYGDADVDTRLIVTRDVGTEVLRDANLTLPEGSTAMDALRQAADVETSHGGGFVEAIDGLASRYPDAKVDWFYHVDTRLADVGAAERTLADDQLVTFDHRSWERTMHLEHVLTGLDAWPTDLDDPSFRAEEFRQLQRDDAERSQLYAETNGSRLTVLDAAGEPARTIEAPWLLAHAVDGPDEEPRILLVPSGEDATDLVDELPEVRPTGVGAVVTPDASLEVPAG